MTGSRQSGPRDTPAGPQTRDTAPAQALVGTGAAPVHPGTQDSWFELLLLFLRAPDNPVRHAVALVVGWAVAGLTLVLIWESSPAGNILFVVYPLLWIIHRTRRTGILATVAFSVGLAAVDVARAPGDWVPAVADAGVSCLFSLFIGLWIWRTYEVSALLTQTLASEQAAREALAQAQGELAAAERHAGTLAERQRWAREVHDTLAQGFVSVVALSQAAGVELGAEAVPALRERLDQIEEVARENLVEARALVNGDGPSALLDSGLAEALERLVETQGRRGLDTSLCAGIPDGLPPSTQVVVLRTVQEALSNVARHARASSVWVTVAPEDGELVVAVQDDGVGAHAAPEGTGLTGMRARVESLGGTLTVDPVHAPDAHGRTGTILEARMPL